MAAGGLDGPACKDKGTGAGNTAFANGAVYNLVEDMDELHPRVGDRRTMGKADRNAKRPGGAKAHRLATEGTLSCENSAGFRLFADRISADENLELWRALGGLRNKRMAPGQSLSAMGRGGSAKQMDLFPPHFYRGPIAPVVPSVRTGRNLEAQRSRHAACSRHDGAMCCSGASRQKKMIRVQVRKRCGKGDEDRDIRRGDGGWKMTARVRLNECLRMKNHRRLNWLS